MPRELFQFSFIERLPFDRDHPSANGFAGDVVRVWDSRAGAFIDSRMGKQDILHLGWTHFATPDVDHVTSSTLKKQEPGLVCEANIAGMKPSILECHPGSVGFKPVPLHYMSTANTDFTSMLRRQNLAVLPDNAHLDTADWSSNRV
jgi:hypothetical protein